MGKVLITTECVADLPLELVEKYNIGIIYYTIKTDKGEFRDTDEITAHNVMEYMMGGEKKALSVFPTIKGYENFFQDQLKSYDEIVHIAISSGISGAYDNAISGIRNLSEGQDRIHVIDSKHLSSGQGLLVLEAARMASLGKGSLEIVDYIESIKSKISTSFLAYNADYLYYNDKVSENLMKLCHTLSIHPVLAMRDGKLTVKSVYIGKYDRAAKKYIKKKFKDKNKMKKEIGFLTYAGCSFTNLDYIFDWIQKEVGFENLYEQQASASISCNCGPNTFGILYIKD